MRRIGLIVLAIAILLGAGALWGLMSLQKSRTALNETTVVVAARPIQLGQALAPDMLRMQTWPANAVPEGSFTDVSQLTRGEARVALRSIEANVAPRFRQPFPKATAPSPSASTTLSASPASCCRATMSTCC